MESKKMKKINTLKKAIFRIQKIFPEGSNPTGLFYKYAEEEYLQILHLLGKKRYLSENVPLPVVHFLYAGCLKFNRWFAPTPILVPQNQRSNYKLFLSSFKKVSPGDKDNTSVLELHSIRDDVFADYDLVPLCTIDKNKTKVVKQAVEGIAQPSHPEKLSEFARQKGDLLAILDGLLSGDLSTRIETKVPYLIHMSPLELEFKWNNVEVSAKITPAFFNQFGIINTPGGAAYSDSASRWSSGISNLRLTLRVLVDAKAATDSLLNVEDKPTPVEGWPQIYTITFNILHDLVWYIRLHLDGERQWIPSPSDIANIDWQFDTAQKQGINHTCLSNPGVWVKSLSPSGEPKRHNIGELEIVPWFKKCRSLATMYFEMGDTDESLFWLNAGIESFFQDKFREIPQKTRKPELEQELNSPKAFWEPAEEIIASQFPNMKGKVRWPETEVHASVYTKLKYLFKRVNMKVELNQVLKHYRNVSKYRNDLFHGSLRDRISIDKIRKVMNSFDWIVENFR